MPLVMIAWAWLMRMVTSWVARKIAIFLLVQLAGYVTYILSKSTLTEISKDIIAAMEKSNNTINQKVTLLYNKIWQISYMMKERVTMMATRIETRIREVMDYIAPDQFNVILSAIRFAAWMDAIIGEIISQASTVLTASVDFVLTPIKTGLDNVVDLLTSVQERLETLEEGINAEIQAWHQSIIDSVSSTVGIFNAQLDSLFDAIAQAYDVFDRAITDISYIVADLKNDVDNHNTAIVTGHLSLSNWLEARLPEMQGMTAEQAAQFAIDLQAFTSSTFTTLSTVKYRIDWDSFRLLNIHHRSDYLLDISIPALDFTVDLAIPELDTAVTDLEAICLQLENVAASVTTRFQNLFPSILRGTMEESIKALLLVAITKMLLEKKIAILVTLHMEIIKINEFHHEMVVDLKDKYDTFKTELFELQKSMIEHLPEVLKPLLVKAAEEIMKSVAESANEVTVNIDDFVPDLEDIDHIVEIFDARIKANVNPNITDSVEFTIQDIYRILCNNFYRTERIALVIMLSTQDMKITAEELEELLKKINEENDN